MLVNVFKTNNFRKTMANILETAFFLLENISFARIPDYERAISTHWKSYKIIFFIFIKKIIRIDILIQKDEISLGTLAIWRQFESISSATHRFMELCFVSVEFSWAFFHQELSIFAFSDHRTEMAVGKILKMVQINPLKRIVPTKIETVSIAYFQRINTDS